MPGLFGFVGTAEGRDAGEFAEAMARALEPQDRCRAELHHSAGAGLGRVTLGLANPEPQPFWNEERTRCVVFEGELYDTDDLKRCLALRGRRLRTGGDAEIALHLYEEFGPDFAGRLNGAFALALWEADEGRLTVINDRLGLFPVYYAVCNGRFRCASGVRALLADPDLSREPDLQAIQEFLVFDHALEDRTMLKAVRLMPQASVLTFQSGRLEIRPYWTLRYPEVYEQRSEAEHTEQLIHHLRQAVKRQQPGSRPAALLLSGGLDSRLLLGLFREGYAGDKFRTFTWGIPGCDDARFSRELAARAGVRHEFFELRPDWLLSLAESAVRLTDGLGNVVNLHAIAALEQESRSAQIMYKGFLGDALLGFAVKRQMWADYEPDVQHRVHLQCHTENGVINYTPEEMKELLSRDFQEKTADRIYRAYRAGMLRSGINQLANQRLFFDLTQRVPRMTLNGVEVMRSRAVVRLPFADNDLVGFVLTVPPGYLFDRYLTRSVVSRYYPELAKVPMTPSNTPLVPCARGLMIQARQLAAWHLKKAGLQKLAGTQQRPYKDYNGWFRTVLRPWVEDTLLSTRSLNRGYFNPGYIRKLVSSHMRGENHAVRIGALLTLEIWHRRLEA